MKLILPLAIVRGMTFGTFVGHSIMYNLCSLSVGPPDHQVSCMVYSSEKAAWSICFKIDVN